MNIWIHSGAKRWRWVPELRTIGNLFSPLFLLEFKWGRTGIRICGKEAMRLQIQLYNLGYSLYLANPSAYNLADYEGEDAA